MFLLYLLLFFIPTATWSVPNAAHELLLASLRRDTSRGRLPVGIFVLRISPSDILIVQWCSMTDSQLDRRQFLRAAALSGTAPLLSEAKLPESGGRKDTTIGLQIGAVSFVDEGTEKVLEILQERGAVNTLFLAVFTYGRGIAGRQVPGQPLPDHGKQEYDLNFHGGNFATPHAEYYKNTVLKDTRAPDHGDLDILETVLPAAKKRGVKTICWLEDVFRPDLPNIDKLQEIDLHGRHAQTLCFNNPNYRNFLTGLVEDYARSYDIDGLMWGSERQGALSNCLGRNARGVA